MPFKNVIIMGCVVLLLVCFTASVFPHCQVPCGIYDDEARFKMLEEDIATIEKAIKQVEELSEAEEKNFNQLVRWINTKEKHASHIIDTATEYFILQRVDIAGEEKKDEYNGYISRLKALHGLSVYAMKAKQSTDLANVERMKGFLRDFKSLYVKNEKK